MDLEKIIKEVLVEEFEEEVTVFDNQRFDSLIHKIANSQEIDVIEPTEGQMMFDSEIISLLISAGGLIVSIVSLLKETKSISITDLIELIDNKPSNLSEVEINAIADKVYSRLSDDK